MNPQTAFEIMAMEERYERAIKERDEAREAARLIRWHLKDERPKFYLLLAKKWPWLVETEPEPSEESDG